MPRHEGRHVTEGGIQTKKENWRVKQLFDMTDLSNVKNDIQRIIGSTVQLETNKGREKAVVRKGVVSNVYPSIFTVILNDGRNTSRSMSFSYTDVLTNTVQITLCEEYAS